MKTFLRAEFPSAILEPITRLRVDSDVTVLFVSKKNLCERVDTERVCL